MLVTLLNPEAAIVALNTFLGALVVSHYRLHVAKTNTMWDDVISEELCLLESCGNMP
jgi:hypothetical protein